MRDGGGSHWKIMSNNIRKMHFIPGISRDILGWLKVL